MEGEWFGALIIDYCNGQPNTPPRHGKGAGARPRNHGASAVVLTYPVGYESGTPAAMSVCHHSAVYFNRFFPALIELSFGASLNLLLANLKTNKQYQHVKILQRRYDFFENMHLLTAFAWTWTCAPNCSNHVSAFAATGGRSWKFPKASSMMRRMSVSLLCRCIRSSLGMHGLAEKTVGKKMTRKHGYIFYCNLPSDFIRLYIISILCYPQLIEVDQETQGCAGPRHV